MQEWKYATFLPNHRNSSKLATDNEDSGGGGGDWMEGRSTGEEGGEEVKWLVPLPPSLFFNIVPNRIWIIDLVESTRTLT